MTRLTIHALETIIEEFYSSDDLFELSENLQNSLKSYWSDAGIEWAGIKLALSSPKIRMELEFDKAPKEASDKLYVRICEDLRAQISFSLRESNIFGGVNPEITVRGPEIQFRVREVPT